jgi:2-isopropylmalate synthase
MDPQSLIYRWNRHDYAQRDTRRIFNRRTTPIELDDETLRDGLQSPSVKVPKIEDKIRILHYMNDLGISIADIGFPAAGEKALEDTIRIASEIGKNNLRIGASCAGRTTPRDIDPMVEVSQKAGVPIEAHIFIGSSMIRRYTEDWSLDALQKYTEEAVTYCTRNGLGVMYVTEDTTRAQPRTIKRLFTTAIEAGARRVCVCDTCGYVTPDGIVNLIDFVRKVIWDTGEDVKIDWHGHNDRGLGLCNALVAAIDANVDRIHGTCLGIGERAGNASIDQILINLYLMQLYRKDLTRLGEYCHFVSKVCDVPIADNYPAVGHDAFRTATGVHAAAIIKAGRKSEDHWLADAVYSGVPASAIGLEQKIEIGPVSGRSNVVYWLEKRGIEPTEERVLKIFEHAKTSDHILTEEEIRKLI